MIFSISQETGWDDEKILDMPLGRVWSYRHALLRSKDITTFFLTNDEDRQEMHELFNSL